MRITQTTIQAIKPKEKPYEIRDDQIKGFLIRVPPTGNSTYVCEYDRAKRKTIGKVSVITLTQARTKAKELLGRYAAGEDLQAVLKKPKTFGEFIQQHYAAWAVGSMRTADKRLREINTHFSFLFEVPLPDISPRMIEKWRLQERTAGKKSSTIRRNETTLRAALSKAIEWKFIADNPLADSAQVKVQDNQIIRYLSRDEESKLMAAIESREVRIKAERESANEWRRSRGYDEKPSFIEKAYADNLKPAVLLSINTGVRAGELLKLKWSSVNFEEMILTVESHTAKSGKKRHIPLNKIAADVLLRWRQQIYSDFVFPGIEGGQAYDIPRGPWESVLKDAQITAFRWHDLRHHFASRLVMASIDLNTVRELLGHSDTKMTLRYAHLAPEHKAAAVAALEPSNEH